jgi:hypothetical protein
VGGPVNPLLSDGGLSTMITGGKGVDRGLASNLQRMQARTEVGGDRTLIAAFREIGKICSAMKLQDVVKHQANEYYKEARPFLRACPPRLTPCLPFPAPLPALLATLPEGPTGGGLHADAVWGY